MIQRRRLLIGTGLVAAGTLAAPAIVRAETTVKMGALRLVHSMPPYFYEKFAPAGLKIEITVFDSPTDGKNAVVTKSMDFGTFGIAAAILGGAAGEPVVVVGAMCNKGMGVISKAGSDVKSIKDLKGKKVGIWPGSTQEVFIFERLKMEGMSVKDITPVRVPFGEMPAMLQRGDIDAYVGAEPAAGISLANGTGVLVEYPYSTPIGPLNMILSASEKAVKENPERIKLIVDMHRKAVEYAMANPPAIVEMAMQKLGQQKKSIELAVPNVELAWKLDDVFMERAGAYTRLMFENKQIRQMPDLNKVVTKQFM